jgi:hypothetical protein
MQHARCDGYKDRMYSRHCCSGALVTVQAPEKNCRTGTKRTRAETEVQQRANSIASPTTDIGLQCGWIEEVPTPEGTASKHPAALCLKPLKRSRPFS